MFKRLVSAPVDVPKSIKNLDVRGVLTWLLASFLLLAAASGASGQAVSRINGTVTDRDQGSIEGATVTATNVDTNVSKSNSTTSAGTFLIIDLIPGTYTVKVEKTGFKLFLSKSVSVVGGATSTVDAILEPGAVSETVEVLAPEVSLQTEQPELGTTINQTLTQELPQLISGDLRQIDSFIFLAPGVTGNGFSHRINGGVDQQTEVMFNGVPESFSETAGFTTWNQPPYDSIKDVDILTGSFSAQYGLGQGVEQYTTKSGTNALHGNVFAFYRDAYFDAAGAYNDIFGNNNGKIGAPNTDHETDWGFSLGGPVWIPKVYNGRNKTFWFFSIDKFRFAQGQSPVTVPNTAETGGDFSGLVNPSTGVAVPIYVPVAWGANPALIPSGCTVPASGPGSPGTQWPGNVIPQSYFSANAKALLSFVPKPTVQFTTPGTENRNYNPSYVPVQTDRDWMFNIDHNLTTKQGLHFLYWRQYHFLPAGWTTNVLNNQTWNYEPAYGVEPRYSYAISPRLVMTAGVLFVHQNNDFYQTAPPPSGGFNAAQPGPYGGNFLPGINFSGGPWEPLSWGTGGWQYSINHKYGVSILNNWLWQHGRHTINFGVDIRKSWQRDYECQQCAGSFTFAAETTADPNETTDFGSSPGTNTGNGFASFLLGNADSANRQFAGDTRLRNSYVAPYFQDDTKLTPKFTVNWGIRWDLAFPFKYDMKYNTLTFFNAGTPNPDAISTVTGQPLLGGMTALGKTGGNCPLCVGWSHMDTSWTHFSPRLGFTYQLNTKTVLLGGVSWYWLDTGAFEYGVNKTAVNFGNNLNGTVGFDPLPNQVPGYGQWDSNPLVAPSSPPLTAGFLNTQFPHQLTKNVRQGYDELFTIGIQRELPWNVFLSVSGVHTHDLHLPSAVNPTNALNYKFVQQTCTQGPSEVFFQDCVLGQAWTSPAAQSLFQSAGFGVTTIAPGACPATSPHSSFSGGPYYAPYTTFGCDYGPNGLTLRGFLPFPMFRGITNNFETAGADKYNGLQMSLQKRTSNGMTFLVSYTLSKYLSNADSGFSTFNFKGLNPANPKAEWSVGNNDQTHVLTMAGVYELPLGPGRKFLNRGGTLMKNVVGGWKIGMVNWYESGTPINVTSTNGTFNGTPLAYTPQGNTPDYVAAGSFNVNWSGSDYHPCTATPCASGTFAAFNPNKFAFPGAWTIGNASPLYNRLRAPAYFDEDWSLSKKFFFNERFSAELGIEFFNVLNRMQPGTCVDTNVGDSNFGLNTQPGIPCQGNAPRKGQAKFQIFF